MRAAVVPAESSPWQIKDVPKPQPDTNQVLVKMHGSGICYTDVRETLGHLPGEFPLVLGHEPVGEIFRWTVGIDLGDLRQAMIVPASTNSSIDSRGQSIHWTGRLKPVAR